MPAPHSPQPSWRVIKSYGHELGLSCAFRQWQADHSHCRFLHGYALGFRFTLITQSLDSRGWCLDFGGLKPLRDWLTERFDHTLLVAQDDPALPQLQALGEAGLAQLRIVDAVGCEAFARQAHEYTRAFLADVTQRRVICESVEVSEHPANAASFTPGYLL